MTSLGNTFGIPWSHDVTSLYQTDYRKHVLSQKRENMFSPPDPIPYSTSARAKELENRKMCFVMVVKWLHGWLMFKRLWIQSSAIFFKERF